MESKEVLKTHKMFGSCKISECFYKYVGYLSGSTSWPNRMLESTL